jgi:hypothetical protein
VSSIEKISFEEIVNVFEASKIFKLSKLNELCGQVFNSHLSIENIFKMYKTMVIQGKKEFLKETFIHAFVENSKEFIEKEEFQNLDKETILKILKLRNEFLCEKLKKKEMETEI